MYRKITGFLEAWKENEQTRAAALLPSIVTSFLAINFISYFS